MPGSADAVAADVQPILVDWLLAAADDVFFLGHRNSDWTGLGPMLEEDLAFSSIAQDEIAHAQAYYMLVAQLTGETPDKIAYGRAPAEYRCAHLVERVDDFDWARAVVRQFYYDHYDALRLARTVHSSWRPLASLSQKLAQEERFHLHHLSDWIRRLGHGTDESKQRLQQAIDRLWPDAVSLFEPVENESKLAAAGIVPGGDTDVSRVWAERALAVMTEAGLKTPGKADDINVKSLPRGGRRGVRSETFAAMLDELAEVYRVEPNAEW
jgi:ring-1,2-phenylacetyl-CoA epoxidase subunit PaaC